MQAFFVNNATHIHVHCTGKAWKLEKYSTTSNICCFKLRKIKVHLISPSDFITQSTERERNDDQFLSVHRSNFSKQSLHTRIQNVQKKTFIGIETEIGWRIFLPFSLSTLQISVEGVLPKLNKQKFQNGHPFRVLVWKSSKVPRHAISSFEGPLKSRPKWLEFCLDRECAACRLARSVP